MGSYDSNHENSFVILVSCSKNIMDGMAIFSRGLVGCEIVSGNHCRSILVSFLLSFSMLRVYRHSWLLQMLQGQLFSSIIIK